MIKLKRFKQYKSSKIEILNLNWKVSAAFERLHFTHEGN